MNIKNIFQKFHRSQFAIASGIITALAGFVVLLGWLFDSNTLKTLAMGGITVKANTAIAFMLAGLTLILLQRKELRKNLLIARILAGALTILGSLVILQYIFNINLGIDEFLFHETEDAFGTVIPGRLAPNAALNFILIGLLFLSLSYPKYERSLFNFSLLITTFIISIIGLLGYIFGIEMLTGIEAFTKMPLATSVIFIIFCTGIFLLMFGKNKYTALEYKLISGLTVAGVFIIFVSFTSVTSIRLLLSTTEKVEHTRKVQEELKNVLSEIHGFVANDRGFLISGNEKFLDDWYGADEKILQTVEKIRTLTKDNPRQQASVKLLDQLVKDRINFSKLLVSTYKTEGQAAALNLFSTLKGKEISDKIDRLITEMNGEEERLLLEHKEAVTNKASDSLLIILFNLFAQIILLAFIFVFVKRDVTGRRKAETELQKLNAELECRVNERTKELEKLNNLLEKTGELARVGGWEIDLRKNELIWSDMVRKIHEVEADYQPTLETGINFYAPESIPVISEAVRRAIEEGKPFDLELPFITAKNNRIWVRAIGQAQTDDGETVAVTGVFQDITESKKAVEDIKKANRVYAVLSNVNQMIVRVKDKQTLFNEACRIAVDDGKFNMAWIGMIDELTQKIIPVAAAGKAEEYIKTINIDLNDKVLGEGPTGRCIKSGVHYITNDIANDPEMVPWREAALKLGNQSSAAFPIKAFGKTIGAYNIYSDEINFFDEAEVKLLDEMAMDISFAVEFLETESRRKQAELEIIEAKKRFDNLVSSLNDVVWTASIDGSKIIDVNESVKALCGRTVEEFKANPKLWIEMIHPDERAIAEASGKELFEKGKAEAEYRIVKPDGTVVWLLDRKSLIYDETGKAVQMGGIAKDITQRKILERRKANQNEILDSIIKGKPLPDILELIVKSVEEEDPTSICSILLLDEEGKHLQIGAAPNLPDFYNQAIDGIEIGEHVGSCGAAAYSKKRVIAEDLLTHPNWIEYRELVQKANLRSCWSEPILDESGNVLGTFAIYHHIPKSPGDNEIELLKSVVALASLAITRKRDEEKIRNMNAELELKVEERTRQLAEINEKLFEEIEERKKIEEELKKAKAEAERANLAKSEFLSRMSHELRTPMNAILGFAQLMDMEELTPSQKKGVAQILKSGKHLLDLINEVLDLAKIEAGKQTVSLEPVNVSEIITQAVDIVSKIAEEKEITIKPNLESAKNIFVKADRQRLLQVLLNLLNNAIKYNRKGGVVSMEYGEWSKEYGERSKEYGEGSKEKGVRISVIDTGVGISKENIEKLFIPFERLGAELKAVEGTGLGLTISKKFIELMNGSIGIESEVGKGSIFWIELPLAEGQIERHERINEDSKREIVSTNLSGTILYVEDNISNIKLVEEILQTQRPGIKLITEMFGKQAVGIAEDYKPDLILLDLDLPDIDGGKVLEQLLANEKTKEIPVVILSADAMSSRIDKLIKIGAKEYLIKPVDVVEFLKVVDGFLSREWEVGSKE